MVIHYSKLGGIRTIFQAQFVTRYRSDVWLAIVIDIILTEDLAVAAASDMGSPLQLRAHFTKVDQISVQLNQVQR